MSRVTLFRSATTLGGVESLVSEPRLSSHKQRSADELAAMGIPAGFLRVSIGLEHVDDLIADLARALES
jgi:cystathionine beta-lyase/cystathionine gamma-synthase